LCSFAFQRRNMREMLALGAVVWRLEKESPLLRDCRRLDCLATSPLALNSLRWKFSSIYNMIFYDYAELQKIQFFIHLILFILINMAKFWIVDWQFSSSFSGGMLVILAMCYLALWMGASTPNPDARLLAPHRDDSYDRCENSETTKVITIATEG